MVSKMEFPRRNTSNPKERERYIESRERSQKLNRTKRPRGFSSFFFSLLFLLPSFSLLRNSFWRSFLGKMATPKGAGKFNSKGPGGKKDMGAEDIYVFSKISLFSSPNPHP